MRSPSHSSESIPAVRLVEFNRDEKNPAVIKVPNEKPLEIGGFRDRRIEQFLSLKDLSDNSKRNYLRQLKAFIEFVDRDWQAVTMNDIRRYKDYLVKDKGLKPASVATAIAAIKSMFSWLEKASLVMENPAAAVSVPTPPATEGKNLEPFQVEALFQALESRPKSKQRDLAILCLLIRAGLRAEEVSHLNAGDYNGVEVLVRQAKHDSVGRVPVDEMTHEALCAVLQQRKFDEAGELKTESPMFVSASNRNLGQRLGYEGIYKLVKDLAKVAGWPEIHPHRGRHTFASGLILDGVDAYLAMELTRHKSVKAFQTYSQQVRYQTAKERFLETKGESERSPMSLEELSRL